MADRRVLVEVKFPTDASSQSPATAGTGGGAAASGVDASLLYQQTEANRIAEESRQSLEALVAETKTLAEQLRVTAANAHTAPSQAPSAQTSTAAPGVTPQQPDIAQIREQLHDDLSPLDDLLSEVRAQRMALEARMSAAGVDPITGQPIPGGGAGAPPAPGNVSQPSSPAGGFNWWQAFGNGGLAVGAARAANLPLGGQAGAGIGAFLGTAIPAVGPIVGAVVGATIGTVGDAFADAMNRATTIVNEFANQAALVSAEVAGIQITSERAVFLNQRRNVLANRDLVERTIIGQAGLAIAEDNLRTSQVRLLEPLVTAMREAQTKLVEGTTVGVDLLTQITRHPFFQSRFPLVSGLITWLNDEAADRARRNKLAGREAIDEFIDTFLDREWFLSSAGIDLKPPQKAITRDTR